MARTFAVDFISGAGYLGGPGARVEAGLPAQGPWRVVTDSAVFCFDERSHRLRLKHLLPPATSTEVADSMGFEPLGLQSNEVWQPPRAEELEILRRQAD